MKRMEGVQKVDIAKILTLKRSLSYAKLFPDFVDKLYDYVANLVLQLEAQSFWS